MEDFGKTAVTFVDTRNERAVRIAPRHDIRELVEQYSPEACNRWATQLFGYQLMPNEDLLDFKWVTLCVPASVLIGHGEDYTFGRSGLYGGYTIDFSTIQ